MQVDIANIARGDARIFHRHLDGARRLLPALLQANAMVRLARRAVTCDLGENLRSPGSRVFIFFQHEHPGTFRHDKAVELAKARADELSKRGKAGEDLAKVAKSLALEAKTSDLFARTGNIPDVGSAAQLADAFTMAANQTSDPVFLGTNWIVYRATDHQKPNADDMTKQRPDITQALENQKREAAFEAFRATLEASMQKDGKLRYNQENMKRLTSST